MCPEISDRPMAGDEPATSAPSAPKTEKSQPKKPTAKKPAAKKSAAKKLAAKKSTVKTAKMKKPGVKKPGQSSRTTTAGLTPEDRRKKLFQAMRSLGATDAAGARSAEDISSKSGLTKFDVYGLCYHKNRLVTEGFVKIAKHEGVRGLTYYLTAKAVKA